MFKAKIHRFSLAFSLLTSDGTNLFSFCFECFLKFFLAIYYSIINMFKQVLF